ncbi:MAG: Ig-like domain-containing protein [Deltaproteobacteria bacterium]|nr:Ig-like domain-containing protein [Deltaproteobacteria bacterium]
MNKYGSKVLALAAILSFVSAGCGEPMTTAPNALKVVFLPLDGAANVSLDTSPSIYFSADVAESSLGDSVFLQSSTLTCTTVDEVETCECGTSWTSVAGSAELSVDNPKVVVFEPQTDLSTSTCYLLVITTAVRGATQGPLNDIGLPQTNKDALGLASYIKVGAMQLFSTVR